MSSLGNSVPHGPIDVECLYREFEPGVRRGRWRLPDGYEAQDVLHDLFVHLLQRDPDAEVIRNPKNYIKRAIKHGRIDRSKRKSRNNVSIDELTKDEHKRPVKELIDQRRNPEMQAAFNEQDERYHRMLRIACSDLSEREKALLALHLQGLTNEEIAHRLEEKVSAIRSDMNAVMMKIRYRVRRLLENDRPPST